MRIVVDWYNIGTRMGCTTKWQRQASHASSKTGQLGFRLVYNRLVMGVISSHKKVKLKQIKLLKTCMRAIRHNYHTTNITCPTL